MGKYPTLGGGQLLHLAYPVMLKRRVVMDEAAPRAGPSSCRMSDDLMAGTSRT
jgi:hypothetical protein